MGTVNWGIEYMKKDKLKTEGSEILDILDLRYL